jgi:hypothetical protein
MLERLDPRPAGLVLASPCNPAGTMLPPDEFVAIARWCEAEGVRLGIGRDLPRPVPRRTARGNRRRALGSAVVVNSFSNTGA